MDLSKGYIPVPRSILDHWLWGKKDFGYGQAYIDLLLLANYSSHKFLLGNKIIEVEPGTVITSEVKLAARWGWKREKVMKYLKLLEDDQLIVKKSTRQGTTITILNYGFIGNMGTTKGTTKEQQRDNERDNERDTNNKDNKEKKEIYIELFEELWKLYPKKLGKGQVSLSQKKKLYQIGRDEIIRAVNRYKRETIGKDSQYIQYGSTFFNKGYIDYLDSNYTDPEQASDLDSIVDQCMHDKKGISS